MVIVVNTFKGTLGPCWPASEEIVYIPHPDARGIAVFIATGTGNLNLTVGMEFGSGNFMDLQESITIGSDAHVEVWTLVFPGPANPTTIKFLANGSGLTGAILGVVEFSGNDPDRTKVVGFKGSSIGANSVEINTPWTAENSRSVMLDAFSLKGKSKMTVGAGQTELWKQQTSIGKAAGSSEDALTGFGPAIWTIGASTNRRYAHVVIEIRAEEVIHTGDMIGQAGPAGLNADGDVEHDGVFDPVVGQPAFFNGIGDVEHKGSFSIQAAPAGLDGVGDVEHEGTMRERAGRASLRGQGNNNTDRFGSMVAQAEPAGLDGVGDVEHEGAFSIQAAPAGFTGAGNSDKTGTFSGQAAPAALDGVGDVEHIGSMSARAEIATVNFRGDVEHEGTMSKQTAPATLRGTGNKGNVLVGFDVASRNFVVTIDAQFTGIRVQFQKAGSSSTIYMPPGGNSVIIRKLT